MSAFTLHRSDPSRNMWRYYGLDVQRDLFGAWCCIREWGRTGKAGQTRSYPTYPTLPSPPRSRLLTANAAPRSVAAMSEPQKPEAKRPKVAMTKPRPPKAATAGPQKKPAKQAKAKKNMSLAALAEGMPGLTAASGQTLAEAAAVCLEDRKHQTGVRLPRSGLMNEDLHVEWLPVDDQNRRCYADMQEATERGACGVAILVIKEVTGMVVIERSKKGTGFDYWLGAKDYDGLPFQGTSRLEVSGILTGTKTQIDSRLKQKKDQIAPTDHIAPGYVAVVEFGTPIACVENK